jgi:uncharacterized membrane protein YraQ (UPF0718 family)
MGVVAIGLLIYAYQMGGGEHVLALKSAGQIMLQVLPMLVFVFIIAGVVQYILPMETVAKWVGTESGMRGILIGTLAGGITPGGPMVSMPIAAGLLSAGAGIGTMVAFMTGWSLWAFSRIPLEVGLMGWKFTAIRLACTFFFPIIAGLLANALFSRINLN